MLARNPVLNALDPAMEVVEISQLAVSMAGAPDLRARALQLWDSQEASVETPCMAVPFSSGAK